MTESVNIIALTQRILQQAIDKKASDIHIEPTNIGCKIRIRVDGVLSELDFFAEHIAKPFITRLKILAKLNIAEQRIPQDGQLILTNANDNILCQSFRISTIPIAHGEKVVLRIMENNTHFLALDKLGFSDAEFEQYQIYLNAPQGLILVTGPTGSGKTVTLYSGLQTMNRQERNISTVEDPIEILLDQINQTQINHKIGLDFELMLRALLRQDPDVLMIGEIRDRETAEIAIQSAQTGHLVLSTLHTNSSVDAMIRLKQMGIPTYLLAASVRLIIAQRLVRKLCSQCKVQQQEEIPILKEIRTHFIAKGCEKCQKGYSGRTALYEFLPINEKVKTILYDELHYSYQQFIETLQAARISTLKKSAILAIQSGQTSFNEVYRVLGNSIFHDAS